MKILAVSDKVDPTLRGPGLEARAAGVDVVLSCGDLPFEYLEYLVTFLGIPVFYVRGNHDPSEESEKLPAGCVPLEGRIEHFGGFDFAGLSGCRWYSGGPNQYTEPQMRRRGVLLSLKLYLLGLFRRGSPRIFVSHASPLGVGDGDDACHTGFGAFVDLLNRHLPALWVHGHVHLYRRGEEDVSGESSFGTTKVVNAYGYRIIEV